MNDLLKRTISGAVYVLVMLGGTLIHPFVFAVVFAILLFFTQSEFYSLVKNSEHAPSKWVGTIAGVLFFLAGFGVAIGFLPKHFSFAFVPFILLIFVVETIHPKSTLTDAALTLLGFIYIALPFALMNFIVLNTVNGQQVFYPWILAGVFFIIWIYDSAAYMAGSMFGRHKVCERISPAKSWEGVVAGTVLAVVTGILNAVLFQAISMVSWIVIALITAAFGTFGDFFESKFKRGFDVKDSGKVLPGHGGLLDRFDSLLFAVPAVFLWLMFSGNI